MPNIKVVNLTGVTITVSNAVFPPAGQARIGAVQEIKHYMNTEHGGFLLVKEAEVEGLPPFDGETRYIVTREVASAAMANGRGGYDLLYAPSELTEDENGQLECEVLTAAQWLRR